ncbi:CopG family transcriptional regulator [Oxalobacteraceae bacterium]|nr:CopG family transcriptional regulator [Oxalobacteraceae bacterium]
MSEADFQGIPIELDEETHARVLRLGRQRGESISRIAAEAVRHYLDWVDGLNVFDRGAVEAAIEHKKNGLHLTSAEADSWLAELEAGNDVEPPACHS